MVPWYVLRKLTCGKCNGSQCIALANQPNAKNSQSSSDIFYGFPDFPLMHELVPIFESTIHKSLTAKTNSYCRC